MHRDWNLSTFFGVSEFSDDHGGLFLLIPVPIDLILLLKLQNFFQGLLGNLKLIFDVQFEILVNNEAALILLIIDNFSVLRLLHLLANFDCVGF